MGSTFRFLAVGEDLDVVGNWFEASEDEPVRHETPEGAIYHFESFGEIVRFPNSGKIDVRSSPLVNVIRARHLRGVLWTTGEVHFLPTNQRETFPGLDRISARFGRWLTQHELVFRSGRDWSGEWNEWLEAGIRNKDASVYALPDAMERLRAGGFFVSGDATPMMLDRLCGSLRLRGIQCEPEGG